MICTARRLCPVLNTTTSDSTNDAANIPAAGGISQTQRQRPSRRYRQKLTGINRQRQTDHRRKGVGQHVAEQRLAPLTTEQQTMLAQTLVGHPPKQPQTGKHHRPHAGQQQEIAGDAPGANGPMAD